MNTSKNYYTINTTFTTFMVISLLAGLVFFGTNTLDFIIAAISYNKASISNIAYCLSKIVGTVLLPLVFILPLPRIERIQAAKVMFYVYGGLQLLTLSWIIEFIIANGFGDLFSNKAIIAFQSAEAKPFVASLAYWDTYSWGASLLTLLFSGLCIYTGVCFDDTKHKVCLTVLGVALLKPLLTIISNLILGNEIMSGFWLTNNYADIISSLAFTVAIFVAARYDETWISLIWDHEVPQDEDEA